MCVGDMVQVTTHACNMLGVRIVFAALKSMAAATLHSDEEKVYKDTALAQGATAQLPSMTTRHATFAIAHARKHARTHALHPLQRRRIMC